METGKRELLLTAFKMGSRTTGYAGYSVGNRRASRGNHFFLLELGYNFN